MKKTILKSTTLFLIALSSLSQNVNAQGVGTGSIREAINPTSNYYYATFTLVELDRDRIEGTVYVDKKPQKANINENQELVPFRYNAFHDMIEVNAPNERTFSLVKEKGNKISNKDITYVVYEDLVEKTNRFFKVEMYLDNVTLLTKESVRLDEAKVSSDSYRIDRPAKLKRLKDTFYVSFGDYEAHELPRNKEKFLALFGNKKEAVKSFIKKNGLNHKKKKDIIHILKYYNSLKEANYRVIIGQKK